MCMETVGHQTTVPAKLDGKDPIAIFAFHCQDVNMAHAKMLLNATALRDGKGHTVTSPVVAIAPMANVLLPMNVSAIMDGLVITAMSVNLWQDVFMVTVWIILTPVSVRVDGRVIFVTSLTALWIATMDFVIQRVLLIPPTSAFATLDGEARPVTSVALTGDAPIRLTMLATIPMNVSVLTQRMIQKLCVTTLF